MIPLIDRLHELGEPPGAELLDMDSILLQAGYTCVIEDGVRIYEHEEWGGPQWTFRNDWRLVPVGYARQVIEYVRRKLLE